MNKILMFKMFIHYYVWSLGVMLSTGFRINRMKPSINNLSI